MKYFLAVIGTIFLSTTAFAGEFEFEVVRTPEVPGFFMVQVFPTSDAAPLDTQTVFVENFEENNAERYRSLEPLLLESGSLVVSRDQLTEFSLMPDIRLAILGNSIGEIPTLTLTDEDDAFEVFETFQTEHLQPVFLKNLSTEFGGNISDVFIDTSEFSGEYPAVVVGKFEKSMRTRMLVEGDSAVGALRLESPLPLNDETLSEHPLSAHLPGLWEKMSTPETDPDEPSDWRLMCLNWFPVVLVVLGILILVGWFARARRKYREDLEDDDFGDETPVNHTNTPYPSAPQSPPFELINRERDQS